jgi:hypothetical protein
MTTPDVGPALLVPGDDVLLSLRGLLRPLDLDALILMDAGYRPLLPARFWPILRHNGRLAIGTCRCTACSRSFLHGFFSTLNP